MGFLGRLPRKCFPEADVGRDIQPSAGWATNRAGGCLGHGQDILVVPFRYGIGNKETRLGALMGYAELLGRSLKLTRVVGVDPLYPAATAKPFEGLARLHVPFVSDRNQSNQLRAKILTADRGLVTTNASPFVFSGHEVISNDNLTPTFRITIIPP